MTRESENLVLIFFRLAEEKYRRELAGVRRYAKSRGWRVVTVEPGRESQPGFEEFLAGLHPAGCIVECSASFANPPPRIGGAIPTVYLDSPSRIPWRRALRMDCDNAAVAKAAFRELSSGVPPSYAVVGFRHSAVWSRKRMAEFRKCCRGVGRPCLAFEPKPEEDAETRRARLRGWVSALPRHCAVFAVNDTVAKDVMRAFRTVGMSVPYDATLVGVDGIDHKGSDALVADISSVRLDFEQAGYLAAKMLVGAGGTDRTCGPGDDCPARRARRANPSRPATFGPLLVDQRKSTRGRGRREPYVLEAVETIRREACDGLTAAALAARVRCSRHLFEMRFRETMGHSVLEEILQVRISRAIDLLSRPEVPIGAIAQFCGFRSDIALRKLFRKRFGIGMREWRGTRR